MQKSNLINLGCGKTFHPTWDNFDLVPADALVRPLDLLKPFHFQNASYQGCYSSHVLEHMPRSYVPQFLGEMFRILRPGGVVLVVVPDLEGIVRRYLLELDAASSGDESAIPRHEWMCMELLDQMTRSFSGGFMGRLWYSRPLPARETIKERLGNEAGKWIEKFDGDFLQDATPLTPEQVFEATSLTQEEEVAFRNQGEIHRWMYDRVSLKTLLQAAGFRDVVVCRADDSRIPDFSTYRLDTDELGNVRKPDSLFMEGTR